jgi:alkylmercury lyase
MEHPSLNQVLEAILKLRSALSETEQQLSLELYRLLALGQPVAPEALAQAVRLDRARVDAVLSDWPGVYRDDQRRVIGYGGLTIAKMRHRMLVDGRQLYAWCAWDTLFLPDLLGSAALVESSCPVSDARISLNVTPEGVDCEGERPLVSFVLPDPKQAAADVVSNFCHYVYFFATGQGARDWAAAHPGTILATLDKAWELGRERNARCYPGRQRVSVA